MKVAELERKHRTRQRGPIRELKTCKWCGAMLGKEARAKLCQACREFDQMLNEDSDVTCARGHKHKYRERCLICKREARNRHRNAVAEKRKRNA